MGLLLFRLSVGANSAQQSFPSCEPADAPRLAHGRGDSAFIEGRDNVFDQDADIQSPTDQPKAAIALQCEQYQLQEQSINTI
jgi:hypothetical protein